MNKGTVTRAASAAARGNIFASGLNFYFTAESVFGPIAEGDLVEFDPVPKKAFKAVNVRRVVKEFSAFTGSGFPILPPSNARALEAKIR